ncbi:MAG: hypothetical protein OXR66_09650 [Candidatus Woesearchaeota archaeon]|nr:hypothetical protein [Candidatus Woesearchaeota archaeon]
MYTADQLDGRVTMMPTAVVPEADVGRELLEESPEARALMQIAGYLPSKDLHLMRVTPGSREGDYRTNYRLVEPQPSLFGTSFSVFASEKQESSTLHGSWSLGGNVWVHHHVAEQLHGLSEQAEERLFSLRDFGEEIGCEVNLRSIPQGDLATYKCRRPLLNRIPGLRRHIRQYCDARVQ